MKVVLVKAPVKVKDLECEEADKEAVKEAEARVVLAVVDRAVVDKAVADRAGLDVVDRAKVVELVKVAAVKAVVNVVELAEARVAVDRVERGKAVANVAELAEAKVAAVRVERGKVAQVEADKAVRAKHAPGLVTKFVHATSNSRKSFQSEPGFLKICKSTTSIVNWCR